MSQFIWESPPWSPEWATAYKAVQAMPESLARTACLTWMILSSRKFPDQPPTYIAPHDGGIMVDREDGDRMCEIYFKPDGTTERTDYSQGKVVRTMP